MVLYSLLISLVGGTSRTGSVDSVAVVWSYTLAWNQDAQFGETVVGIQQKVMPLMNQDREAPVTDEVICAALFQMPPEKSPRPDGMPGGFYQQYWDVLSLDIYMAVRSFLEDGKLLAKVNFTHICFIPKVNMPEYVSHLRPIALCNILYKICSKVLANRLKLILPQVISPSQSAFVSRRLGFDIALVAIEMNHLLHTKRAGSVSYMALKLDVSKAHDRLDWNYLKEVVVSRIF